MFVLFKLEKKLVNFCVGVLWENICDGPGLGNRVFEGKTLTS